MLELPKIVRDPKETEDLCKCRPVCHNRRRLWKGQLQKTSGELKIERKPRSDCKRRWPKKVYPNSPCPLFGRSKQVIIKERGVHPPASVVRLCQAPMDTGVDTTYLRMVEIARMNGAWRSVRACCAFCQCCACCSCSSAEHYRMRDPERDASRREDMREFDARIKRDFVPMRIMYQ